MRFSIRLSSFVFAVSMSACVSENGTPEDSWKERGIDGKADFGGNLPADPSAPCQVALERAFSEAGLSIADIEVTDLDSTGDEYYNVLASNEDVYEVETTVKQSRRHKTYACKISLMDRSGTNEALEYDWSKIIESDFSPTWDCAELAKKTVAQAENESTSNVDFVNVRGVSAYSDKEDLLVNYRLNGSRELEQAIVRAESGGGSGCWLHGYSLLGTESLPSSERCEEIMPSVGYDLDDHFLTELEESRPLDTVDARTCCAVDSTNHNGSPCEDLGPQDNADECGSILSTIKLDAWSVESRVSEYVSQSERLSHEYNRCCAFNVERLANGWDALPAAEICTEE